LHSTPLIFGRAGDAYVIVASQGGRPAHPDWYRNLVATPEVQVQVKADVFRARARTAEGEERERLWRMMNGVWRHYDEYQTRTERVIPVVVLDRI
jgi:deazaflavin-dependent oxidoreductase (nitroreductase family)